MTLFLNDWHRTGAISCSSELLFAIDMMSFVTKQFRLPYSPFPTICCFGNIPETPFKGNIKKLIGILVDEYIKSTFNSFVEMNREKNPSYELISEWTALYTRSVKVSGYGNADFLIHCTMICLMTSAAYCFGVNMAPNNGIMEICELVAFFKKTSEWPLFVWEELQDTAERHLNVGREIKKNVEYMLRDLDNPTEADYDDIYAKMEDKYVKTGTFGVESSYLEFESEFKDLNLNSKNEDFQFNSKGVKNQVNLDSITVVKRFDLDSMMENKHYELDSAVKVNQFDRDSAVEINRVDLDCTVEIKQFDQCWKTKTEQFELDSKPKPDQFDLYCKAEDEKFHLNCETEQNNLNCSNETKPFDLDCLNEKKEFNLYCPAEEKKLNFNCPTEIGDFDLHSKSEIRFDLNSLRGAKHSDHCFKPYSKYLDFKIDINNWKSILKIEVEHFDLDSSIKTNHSDLDSKVEAPLSAALENKFKTLKCSFIKTLEETQADGNRLGLAWII